MDPFSQAALGAVLPQSTHRRSLSLAKVALFGALAGMAPDLDIFIRSTEDPLLFLEYHRQFTHALIFVPIGALLCAAVFWPLAKRDMSFSTLWIICALGYGTHGLLDACTTYGTQLLWPFSDVRIAWNNVSVVDPLFTVPLLIAVFIAARRNRPLYARLGLVWALAYLSFGLFQSHRAEQAGMELAALRGHTPTRLDAKPGFANVFLWKVVYEHDGRFYVDAVRTGWETQVYTGDSVPKLDAARQLPWLAEHSQQAVDVQRFNWFSNDYLAIDSRNQHLIVDMRYSLLPNEIDGLWGIELDPAAEPGEHVRYVTRREASPERIDQWFAMLFK